MVATSMKRGAFARLNTPLFGYVSFPFRLKFYYWGKLAALLSLEHLATLKAKE